MNDKAMMLKRVQMYDFALNDASLYLDTHPEDKMALSYYKKYLAMRKEAAKEYMEKYGPLFKGDYDGGERWNWADGPWPWQLQEEV